MRRTPCGCTFEMVGGGSLKMSYSGPLCDTAEASGQLFKQAEQFIQWVAAQQKAARKEEASGEPQTIAVLATKD